MQTIGFIGAGAMGQPMAERLLEGGFGLKVFDPSEAATAPLAAMGATIVGSPLDAATGVALACACLPSPAVSVSVAEGIAGSPDLRTYIEMSTIGTAAIERIAGIVSAGGIALVDAPVSGGPRGARAGELTTMVGCTDADFARAETVLTAIARNVRRVGAKPGLGQVMKVCNNLVSAAGMAASFEAAVLAVKAGIDADTFIDVINVSTGRCGATLDKFPASILNRKFDYGGKLGTMFKDISLYADEAQRMNTVSWVGASVVQLWFHAMSQGRADDDYTTLIKMIEEWGGAEVIGASASASG